MGTIDMCDEFELVDRPRHGRAESDLVRLAALGLMTSGIVHDFRNLMQVFSSAIRLIEQKLDQPARGNVAPFISGALQSVDRATALSRQLLGVSRKENALDEAVHLESVLTSMRLPICWVADGKNGISAVRRTWILSPSESGDRSRREAAQWARHGEMKWKFESKEIGNVGE
jgi:signal transduction histidine kinase